MTSIIVYLKMGEKKNLFMWDININEDITVSSHKYHTSSEEALNEAKDIASTLMIHFNNEDVTYL